MPFGGLLTGLIGGGISGLAGLFGSKKQQTSNTNNTSTSTPNLTPQQQSLINQFVGGSEDINNQDQNISGYEGQGLQNINNNANLQSKTVQNLLASRGLSYSPAAVSQLANVQGAKAAQSSQFENQLPLLQRSLKEDSLSNLMKSFGLIPTGSTSTSKGTSTGTASTNPMAGLLSGFGAGLFSGYSPGGGGGSGSTDPTAGILSSLGLPQNGSFGSAGASLGF